MSGLNRSEVIEMLEAEWRDRLKAAVLAEREACAKVCEGINSIEDYYENRLELVCAEAIRERK